MAERGISEITSDLAVAPRRGAPMLFSVGHSNVPSAAFIDLLRRHRIEAVADVRSSPRSRFVPHFDAGPLQRSLADAGIGYVALGAQLGGRPDRDDFYDDNDHVLYDKVAGSAPFATGIERLLRGADRFRVALLCSEEDPTHCHRRLLISRVLAGRGVDVMHIRHDGSTQTDQALASAEQTAADATPRPLFSPAVEERAWRSSRSVSRKRPPRRSSAP